jgi:hypothetical protein
MHSRRYKWAFLVLVGVLFVVACTCNGNGPVTCPSGSGTRTSGNDEFKRWHTKVFKGPSTSSSLPEFKCTGWHPLADRDALSTDNSGEAELNLSACWPGRIYVFKDSGANFQVETCTKSDFPTSGTCVPFGTWYVGGCAGEFDIFSGSAKIVKRGTSFSVTYLPDNRETTLVVVLEGQVDVAPVLSVDPTRLDVGASVAPGSFYFTMPNANLDDVANLPPRQLHPVEALPAVADELRIRDWMVGVAQKADEDGVLPPNWPRELGGQGQPVERPTGGERIFVAGGGGPLEDKRVWEGALMAVDWGALGFEVGMDLAYDPDKSRALLEEAGYPRGFGMALLFPAEDDRLDEAVGIVAQQLGEIGIDSAIEAVPGNEMEILLATRAEAGEAAMGLSR